MVICPVRGADLHMAQLMPLPLTVSCFSKIQIDFTFLVPAHLGSPGKGPLNGRVFVYVLWVCLCLLVHSAVDGRLTVAGTISWDSMLLLLLMWAQCLKSIS